MYKLNHQRLRGQRERRALERPFSSKRRPKTSLLTRHLNDILTPFLYTLITMHSRGVAFVQQCVFLFLDFFFGGGRGALTPLGVPKSLFPHLYCRDDIGAWSVVHTSPFNPQIRQSSQNLLALHTAWIWGEVKRKLRLRLSKIRRI